MTLVADRAGVSAALDHLTAQLCAALEQAEVPVAFVGIRSGGVTLADRLRHRVIAAGLPAPARGRHPANAPERPRSVRRRSAPIR